MLYEINAGLSRSVSLLAVLMEPTYVHTRRAGNLDSSSLTCRLGQVKMNVGTFWVILPIPFMKELGPINKETWVFD